MRIGAYVGAISPEVGGGFTFQDEVLKALVTQARFTSEHEFFVIGTSSGLAGYLSTLNPPSNLSYLVLKESTLFERANEWLRRGILILSKLLKNQGPLAKLAKENRLDLVWFVGGGCFEVIDTPYIATVWDLQHRLQPWFPEVSADGVWAARETQYRHFLPRASYVIVGTDAGRDEVELFYQIPKNRIYKLPHPTPSFALHAASDDGVNICKKYDIPENYIFYPAQFWAHKNHINLLHALSIVRKKYNLNLHLVLVGSDKGNVGYVKQVAQELDLTRQLHILGFVPQSDLYGLYKNASMLAYMSLCGPENLPPLEAFALGCPVVASEVSGSQEQFGEAVLYCDPKNPLDIASKIYDMHTDEKLRVELINKGFIRAKAWTPEDFVQGVFNIANEFASIKRNWN